MTAPKVKALWNEATALYQAGWPVEALATLARALKIAPNFANIHADRALVLRDLKRLDEALASVDKAVSIEPGLAGAWTIRSAVLRDMKRMDEALASIDRVIALTPGSAQAWSNRCTLLHEMSRLDEALASADKAIALERNNADAWHNRGVVLRDMRRLFEALTSLDQAVSLQPGYGSAWYNRGNVLLEFRRADEALASYSKALALAPDTELLLGNYLLAKVSVCDWNGLEGDVGNCVAAIQAGKLVFPFLTLILLDDPALQARAAKVYSSAQYPGKPALGPAPGPEAKEKLRIGYYSADFHQHATSFLIIELLEARNAAKFELYGFSFGPNPQDETRQRVGAAFDKFIDVGAMSDANVARLSRECGIDIAIDLKGYTRDARPGIFAQGCAPIQLQYLGYPGTMGADHMDYLVADRVVIPPGRQGDYAEKIIWLPHSYQPNDSKRKISDRVFTRQEAGLPPSGFVFCCFNNNYKILPETFGSWMRILKAVDGSVLWLLKDNPAAAKNLCKQAAALGVDGERLVFAKRLPVGEHLARQRLADLFLDTFPCNAHTTASDALWAGLPVLTRKGKTFASRVAASLLEAVGLAGLITSSTTDYEALAIALAREPEKLAAVRKTLEEARATAPLFDGKLTARHLEAGFEAIYARYRSSLAPDHVEIGPERD